MKNTVIKKLIVALKEIDKRDVHLTNKGFITMLENCVLEEKEQIINAFDEGVKYGNGLLQTFDYPASRYFEHTYNNLNQK